MARTSVQETISRSPRGGDVAVAITPRACLRAADESGDVPEGDGYTEAVFVTAAEESVTLAYIAEQVEQVGVGAWGIDAPRSVAYVEHLLAAP